jgi:transposase
MKDKELYAQLLGLQEPWFVNEFRLDVAGKRVDVWLEHGDGKLWFCPECGNARTIYDHAEERVWRHLDSCGFGTYVHARIPRVDCPEHEVKQVRVSWAESQARFTKLFERFAIDVLQQCDVSGSMSILNISWKEAWHIKERAVARGRVRKARTVVPKIGVDEKAIAKGHKYMTLVCDIERGVVEHVTEERKKESLEGYFKDLTDEQKTGIKAVAMDMWEPFFQATKDHVPEAEKKIVHDRFHIDKHMTEAVDLVRKQEHRALLKAGDETLSGSKYLWLYGKENIPDNRKKEFAALKAQDLKVGRAWILKEHLRRFWSFVELGPAKRFWKKWYFWATHSRLEPVKKVAAMIKNHLANVLTYFTHRITNAVSEGLNSKIATIQKMAYGFRNPENFKTAIYFHCGGLDLYPC